MNARLNISKTVSEDEAFEVYLTHLLDTIVSKGDAQETSHKHLRDTELAAQEIAQMLKPLATLLARNSQRADGIELEDTIVNLQRDAWFNIVVHGFDTNSNLGRQYIEELRTLARFSKPLIAEERPMLSESDIELNTVLRRGKSPEHTTEQKRRLVKLLPSCEADTKSLTYPEAVFLNAAYWCSRQLHVCHYSRRRQDIPGEDTFRSASYLFHTIPCTTACADLCCLLSPHCSRPASCSRMRRYHHPRGAFDVVSKERSICASRAAVYHVV
jgi:hypothetical protein